MHATELDCMLRVKQDDWGPGSNPYCPCADGACLVRCSLTSASDSARRCSKQHAPRSSTSVSRIVRMRAALMSARPPTRIAASTAPVQEAHCVVSCNLSCCLSGSPPATQPLWNLKSWTQGAQQQEAGHDIESQQVADTTTNGNLVRSQLSHWGGWHACTCRSSSLNRAADTAKTGC